MGIKIHVHTKITKLVKNFWKIIFLVMYCKHLKQLTYRYIYCFMIPRISFGLEEGFSTLVRTALYLQIKKQPARKGTGCHF